MAKPREYVEITTLFGDTVRFPRRGKHYVEPRGYVDFPGGGPAGETCGTCQHACRFRTYIKCGLNQGRWTNGRGTDILARSPACKKWECIVDG